MSFIRFVFFLASLVHVGCSSPTLYLAAHSPQGTQYLGKISTSQVTHVQEWLKPDGKTTPVKLCYQGQDSRAMYILATHEGYSEVLTFEKAFSGPEFAISGMELSPEWR